MWQILFLINEEKEVEEHLETWGNYRHVLWLQSLIKSVALHTENALAVFTSELLKSWWDTFSFKWKHPFEYKEVLLPQFLFSRTWLHWSWSSPILPDLCVLLWFVFGDWTCNLLLYCNRATALQEQSVKLRTIKIHFFFFVIYVLIVWIQNIFWCAACILRNQVIASKQRDFTFLSLFNVMFWCSSTAPAKANRNDET